MLRLFMSLEDVYKKSILYKKSSEYETIKISLTATKIRF